jgi:hypothetical protein
MADREYWFRRRRFRLGWRPGNKNGWAATGVFALTMIVGTRIIKHFSKSKADENATRFRRIVGLAFLTLVVATGEPLW